MYVVSAEHFSNVSSLLSRFKRFAPRRKSSQNFLRFRSSWRFAKRASGSNAKVNTGGETKVEQENVGPSEIPVVRLFVACLLKWFDFSPVYAEYKII